MSQAAASSNFSTHSVRCAATGADSSASPASAARTFTWRASRRCTDASAIPSPNSALSSKSERPHAGPRPLSSTVYGLVVDVPPHTLEHPEALAIIMREPKSCVSSLTYGVSPQPAHAPENSRSGVSNCEPFTVNFSDGLAFTDALRAYSQFATSFGAASTKSAM